MNTKNLIKALEIVKPGLASKEIVEQTTSFAFISGRVVTYNDEISISHPIDSLDLEGAIRAEELYKLLPKLNDDVEITVASSELLVKSKRTKAGFRLQKEVKLPLSELGTIDNWEPIPDGFIEALRFVMFSASKDMSKPVLTCVNVRQDGYMESSDDMRITRHKFAGWDLPTCLIPVTTVRSLVTYKIKEVTMGDSEGWIHFRTDAGTIFSCRLLQEVYPDISGFMKVKGTEIRLPKSLTDILDRTIVFCSVKHDLDYEVTTSLVGNKMTIRSEGEAGWFEETVNSRYKGDPMSFIANPIFLMSMAEKNPKVTLDDKTIRFEDEDWEHVMVLCTEIEEAK
jgi:DNA polymerase III sliding clamp (beta) subunit (PCNA family)